MNLSSNAIHLLKERYCSNGETPEEDFDRVAKALADNESDYMEFKSIMENLEFLPNSPALFGAGLKGCLKACFVLSVDDTLESIFENIHKTAIVYKFGGGVGFNFSKLREKGAKVSKGGTSSGILAFLKIYNDITEAVKQSGKRRGAGMATLNYDHPDILDFITEKLKGGLNNFNLSVMVTDEFMEKVTTEESIFLRSVIDKNKIVQKIKAKDLFSYICLAAWKNGDPGILFFDRINQDNPYDEKIIATNVCQPFGSLLLDNDKLCPIEMQGKTWQSWKTGIKEVIELTCNNGLVLKFTPDHKIMLEDGSFIEARHTLGKSLCWGLGNRKASKIDKNSVIRGFLFGDGFKCGNGYGVSVRLNKDKETEIYGKLIQFGFYEQRCKSLYISKKKIPFSIDFLNARVFNRDLPQDILYGNSTEVASFLRGLFEANGSISRQSQICLKATNKKMIKKVQLLLASFGIPSWLSVRKPMIVNWPNGEYTSKESYDLQIAPRNTVLFKEKIGFVSKKKNQKIRHFEKEYCGKLKVISIKSLGNKDVYDFKMLGNYPYNFCQGIIAHNCAEQPLFPGESCCLGSINLVKCLNSKNKLSITKLRKLTRIGIKMLLQINKHTVLPFDEMYVVQSRYNRIGLGVMGFADMLIKMGVMYDSEESLEIIRVIGKEILTVAKRLSPLSASVLSIAPTGSLSILSDCSSGIEPLFSKEYIRRIGIGDIKEKRNHSKYLRTAHEILPEWHLRIQAEWQKFIDAGVSKTVNLPQDATVEDIRNIFLTAWKLGCKGVTVYRDTGKGVYKRIGCNDEECVL